MVGLVFSLFLVGLPAFAASYMFIGPNAQHERSTALGLMAYAIALTLAHVLLLPDGKAMLANYKLKMPLALAIGTVAGALWGLRKRGQ